jgi:uncharacterized membrane protein HdeD (DUF308 family)
MNKASNKSRSRWSNTLINAIITLIIALILIIVPNTIYKTIIIGIGLVMLFSGIGYVIFLYRSKNQEFKNKVVVYGQAILNITVGIFLLLKPELVLDFMRYFISIWLILLGAIQLFLAPSQKAIVSNVSIILVNSIISLGLGVLILLWPTFPLIIIGYACLLISIILFYYSFVFYKHRNDVVTISYIKEEEIED